MAFKLTDAETKTQAEHVKTLQEKWEALDQARAGFNELIQDLGSAMDDAEAFREEVASRLRDEFDAKSEKWQEGEKANEIGGWIEEWENVDLSLVLEEPEIDKPEGIESLEGLSSEPPS